MTDYKISDVFYRKREEMIHYIKTKYGLYSSEILSAMLQVPRHEFLDRKYWDIAYSDMPVPLGHEVTMSQPYTVAFMTHLLDLTGVQKVLEIGTGSGYQSGILSKLVDKVYSIEIIPELAKRAIENFERLKYRNVWVKEGSGEFGWEEKAPFDAILVTAGIEGEIPKTLFDQLNPDCYLVAPVGFGINKRMKRYKKLREEGGKIKFVEEDFGVFRFVPFVRRKN